ncbi:hypothetical protein ST201phi2-1p344 [Pseudomonas phage 201phi2-1]|uniref:Uncharacterized protein n=1 Tax=Pseudomonas phage 201phi2-1 TaxID=198110 RepID=B3FJK5_BP201|nr:hypothetical protein ST201phi2-1p344 [Pseudomonas phage 201phi2-1]ABY63170.1 hypothetical protein 201phi2-1p344 [Pseudomonas phage 201phi2-1]
MFEYLNAKLIQPFLLRRKLAKLKLLREEYEIHKWAYGTSVPNERSKWCDKRASAIKNEILNLLTDDAYPWNAENKAK